MQTAEKPQGENKRSFAFSQFCRRWASTPLFACEENLGGTTLAIRKPKFLMGFQQNSFVCVHKILFMCTCKVSDGCLCTKLKCTTACVYIQMQILHAQTSAKQKMRQITIGGLMKIGPRVSRYFPQTQLAIAIVSSLQILLYPVLSKTSYTECHFLSLLCQSPSLPFHSTASNWPGGHVLCICYELLRKSQQGHHF